MQKILPVFEWKFHVPVDILQINEDSGFENESLSERPFLEILLENEFQFILFNIYSSHKIQT